MGWQSVGFLLFHNLIFKTMRNLIFALFLVIAATSCSKQETEVPQITTSDMAKIKKHVDIEVVGIMGTPTKKKRGSRAIAN